MTSVGGRCQADQDGARRHAVADTDAAVARATELGEAVQRPCRDGAFGRIAVLQGPDGETFAVIGPNTETPEAST